MKQGRAPIFLIAFVAAALAAGCNRTPPEAAAPAATAPEAPPPAPSPAQPLPPAEDSGKSFEELDQNKDGAITKDELGTSEMLQLHFAVADKDGSGGLSKSEVDFHRAEMAAKPAEPKP